MSLNQYSIKSNLLSSSIAVHSAENVNVLICPADVNSGITFFYNNISFPASCEFSYPSNLCTTLMRENTYIHTIEHFLATVKSLGIDNLDVYIDADEFPIFDGSALPIVKLFEQSKIVEQDAFRKVFRIDKEIKIDKGDRMAAFVPLEEGEEDKFIIDITCDFSEHGLGIVRYVYEESKENFVNDIAMCRTFGFWEDAEKIKAAGLAKGASLENTVIFKDGRPINEGGLRTENEFVKHKVLDAIGDTSLCGGMIIGKFVSICPGHALTNELMKLTFC